MRTLSNGKMRVTSLSRRPYIRCAAPVSLFHSINRNAISIYCRFSPFVRIFFFFLFRSILHALVVSCLHFMRFTDSIRIFHTQSMTISSHSTHFLFHKCSSRFSRRHDTDSFLRAPILFFFFVIRSSSHSLFLRVCSLARWFGCRWRRDAYAVRITHHSHISI